MIDYFVGFAFGFLTLTGIAYVHQMGAQSACESLVKFECELKWVPVTGA